MGSIPPSVDYQLHAQSLWSRYEEIAMHFNDLLMRLRSQGVAGIAAISTLVGIFTKTGVSDVQSEWLAATFIFTGLTGLWIAIGCLDLLYYNRLLMGAVSALVELEANTVNGGVTGIDLSTKIDSEFRRKFLAKSYFARFTGVVLFYVIVLCVIGAGALFSYHMYCTVDP